MGKHDFGNMAWIVKKTTDFRYRILYYIQGNWKLIINQCQWNISSQSYSLSINYAILTGFAIFFKAKNIQGDPQEQSERDISFSK